MPPYMSSRVSLIWASNYLTPHTNAHKTINSMPHIRNPKWGELRPIQPITASGLSPHPFFQAINSTISQCGSTQESFYSQSTALRNECSPFSVFPILRLLLLPNRFFWAGRADHTGQFWYHPSASPVVIVLKVVGQHLFLNVIPNNFTARTEWNIWCDRGMSSHQQTPIMNLEN